MLEEFTCSAKCDPGWAIENLMGPNVLWLTESLSQVMQLEPGMRVLDMGCGRAISSIFPVREFGVQVWATNLWLKPSENAGRIRDADVGDRVFTVHAEAQRATQPPAPAVASYLFLPPHLSSPSFS